MGKAAFVFALFVLAFSACQKEQNGGHVTVHFDHEVAGQPLVFDEIKYTSKAGHPYSVARLKYFVSNVVLHEANGNTFEVADVHYRDAAEPDTRSFTFTSGEVPSGTYDRVSFVFGLDEATNMDGGLPNTQANINMEWPIPGDQGYHYMKLEGKYDSLVSGVIKNFNLHTGAAMGNQNFIEVSLPISSFTVDGNTWGITLVMDINEWLENPNIWDFEEYGPMIMMNQNAQQVLRANGATVFKIGKVEKE